MIEVGFSQLLHGSPGLPRRRALARLAMLPATAPRQKGTSTEERANAAPKLRRSRVRNTALRNAKPAPRSTMPKRGEGERDEQGEGDRGVRRREAGPEHDEAEDQPHVVGFPHRSDRVVDDLAGSFAAVASPGDQVPEPGAEVGAAEDRRTW